MGDLYIIMGQIIWEWKQYLRIHVIRELSGNLSIWTERAAIVIHTIPDIKLEIYQQNGPLTTAS